MANILIVGAGMTGLTAARNLTQRGHRVTVLDKGRGIGGRLATRRLSPGLADHGAPYFSVQTPAFQALADELLEARIIQQWPDNEQDTQKNNNPIPQYAGIGGMNNVAKYMARDLLIETNCRVINIAKTASGWRVTSETGTTHEADALLLTLPVPQALTLLADSALALTTTDQTALESVSYQPCLTALVTLNAPSGLPAPGLVRFIDPAFPVTLVVDNQAKSTSPDQPTLTVYAAPTYSQTHFDDDPATVGRDLLAHLSGLIVPNTVQAVQVHRWRYSTADGRLREPFRALAGQHSLLIGGDGFGPGGVEGAFLSGRSMASAIAH